MRSTPLLALLPAPALALALASCNSTSQIIGQIPTYQAPAGQVVYGLKTNGQIVTFGLDNAANSQSVVNVTGLGSGESLVDLDVRNTDGKLYGVSSAGRVYALSSVGAATADATANTSTVAADFNPAANRLRVVGANDANFRLTLSAAPVPAASPAGTVTNDGTFAYAAGTPNPNLASAAYTNSFNSTTLPAATALYSVDADTDNLVLHSNNATGPTGNFSTLTAVGSLGVNVSVGSTGFDIAGASGAYLSSVSGTSTNFYTVNLTTGAATLKTSVASLNLTSFALALPTQ